MALKRVTDVREQTHKSSDNETRSYKRYHFQVGTSKNPPRTRPWISQTRYGKLREVQLSKPVSVGTIAKGRWALGKAVLRGKTLWWFKDRFYVEAGGEPHPPGHQREDGVTGLVKLTGVHETSVRDSFLSLQKRSRFTTGTSNNAPTTDPWISSNDYPQLRRLQPHKPVSVGTISSGKHKGSTLWWYKDEFYVHKHHRHPPGHERKNGITGLRAVAPVAPVEEAFGKDVRRYEKWHNFRIGPGVDAPSTNPLLPNKEYRKAKKLQSSKPASVGTISHGPHRDKTLWWYQDEFYGEKRDYTSEEVQLLLWEREQKRTRRFQRLKKEMLSERALEDARRERIPEDVRIFVWKRDEGRCVQCGSQDKLEFDHMIPVSKGGGNTARNIQLLCETCNRRKSASI